MWTIGKGQVVQYLCRDWFLPSFFFCLQGQQYFSPYFTPGLVISDTSVGNLRVLSDSLPEVDSCIP